MGIPIGSTHILRFIAICPTEVIDERTALFKARTVLCIILVNIKPEKGRINRGRRIQHLHGTKVREMGRICHRVKSHVHRRLPDWFVAPQQQTKEVMVVDPSATDQAHALVQCLLQKQTGSADRPSLHDSELEFVNMPNGSEQTFVVKYLAHQMKEHQRVFLLRHGYNRSSAGVATSGSNRVMPGYNSLTCFYPTAFETRGAHK